MHLFVAHPFAGRRSRRDVIDGLMRGFTSVGQRVELFETTAAPGNSARISARLGAGEFRTVLAAGGDGTVRDVVEAATTLPLSLRPRLVVVPLGTANNVAQVLGQLPRRLQDADSLTASILPLLDSDTVRHLDVGRVGGRAFVGSFAAGMDADILTWRGRMAPRVPTPLAGYPLYLASCAVNAARSHGGHVEIEMEMPDGSRRRESGQAFNLLVTNTAIHAGEFRFCAGVRHEDGLLDLIRNGTRGDYLGCYARAWPRHLGFRAGRSVASDVRAVAARRIALRYTRPVDWQVDGETMPAAAVFDLDVQPAALIVPIR
jgi:diacylglycerol kinase family enzyme